MTRYINRQNGIELDEIRDLLLRCSRPFSQLKRAVSKSFILRQPLQVLVILFSLSCRELLPAVCPQRVPF